MPARGYRAARGELRFDMAGAEFTHQGGRCTFEVLLDHIGLHDAGLRPIAEIVHELDLRDGRYTRPEASGVERTLIGLALQLPDDAARIAQAATLFEGLYQSFRRRDRGGSRPSRPGVPRGRVRLTRRRKS